MYRLSVSASRYVEFHFLGLRVESVRSCGSVGFVVPLQRDFLGNLTILFTVFISLAFTGLGVRGSIFLRICALVIPMGPRVPDPKPYHSPKS